MHRIRVRILNLYIVGLWEKEKPKIKENKGIEEKWY